MFSVCKRCFFIIAIFVTYRLDDVLPIKKLNGFFRLLRLGKKRDINLPSNQYERLREALEMLGPIFVKFGQALSTRPDLLAPELAKELAKLQDKVKAFPCEEAVGVIEAAFSESVDTVFEHFDQEVLASASIAQVHTATLPTGEPVVVKVVRPGIEQVIRCDLAAMRFLAKLVTFIVSDFQRLRLPELVDEFAHTLTDELDLRQEAANATKLRANFPNSESIYVPKIYWNLVRQNVMVMERIYATPISDLQTLTSLGVDMEKLAARGVEIFFTQVFQHQYFHADMHPGNIFVDISDPKNPQYKAVDFGIMGSLSREDQYYLAENFLAFFNRDYYRVAKLHIDSGWVPSYVKVHELEAAVRKVGEPIFGKPLDEISFGEFLITLVQVARRFDMIVQPQLLLLQKTVLNVEGLGRVLYPKLDLWATAKPILETWMKERFGPKAFLQQIKATAPEYRDVIPKIPQLIEKQLAEAPPPKAENSSIFWALLLIGFSAIVVAPNLWQADITRPVAMIAVAGIVMRLWRNHRRSTNPF